MAKELSTKKILYVFIPALLLGALALFIEIIRYEPQYPKITISDTPTSTGKIIIPILQDDPVIGERKAPITIIAFEDFSCPACKVQHELLTRLQTEIPHKIKVIWKGLPVNDFPYPATDALTYGFCANKQNKFDTFASYAYANQDNLSIATLSLIATEAKLDTSKLSSCLSSAESSTHIELTKNIAKLMHVQSVPTFFIDNTQIKTPTSFEEWKQMLKL